MIKVKFTPALNRFQSDLKPIEVEGSTVKEVMLRTFEQFPKLRNYVLEDQGAVRKHVNIFVNGTVIRDRTLLSDELKSGDEIFIIQALSGG